MKLLEQFESQLANCKSRSNLPTHWNMGSDFGPQIKAAIKANSSKNFLGVFSGIPLRVNYAIPENMIALMSGDMIVSTFVVQPNPTLD
jgi:hypothetical protein